jgi:hypothetical protein
MDFMDDPAESAHSLAGCGGGAQTWDESKMNSDP